VFDKYGRVSDVFSSDEARISFGPLSVLNSVAGNDKGFIQDFIWFQPDAAIPGHVPSSLTDYGSYDVVVFTRTLSAAMTINGQSYATPSYVPWDVNSNVLSTIANAYAHVLGAGESVAFITGDVANTVRGASIYFLLDPSVRPADCNAYPEACVDLSSLVSKGEDFTIGLAVTENWRDYETTYDPLHSQVCDNRLLLGGLWCVHNLDEHSVKDTYSMKLTNFGYFTTNPAGQTTFIQTQYSTAHTTVVIHISTTVENEVTKIVVAEEHQTTTISATETLTGPPSYGFCSLLPKELAWLCGSSWGLPNWAWVLLAIVVLWLLLRRGNGSNSVTVISQSR
jgi:hypothetical protein